MNNGNDLSVDVARRIIDRVGGSGQPPEYGFQYFTAGLEPYLSVIDEEYLGSFIKQGGSTFKMVVGVYGGGKTHFLYCVRDLAWQHNFVVSYVSLSPEDSPFHRLDLVYRAIINNIVPPLSSEELLSGYEKGIEAFIKRWYSQKSERFREQGYRGDALDTELRSTLEGIGGVESTSFSNAVKEAFRALMSQRQEDFDYICQWIKGLEFEQTP